MRTPVVPDKPHSRSRLIKRAFCVTSNDSFSYSVAKVCAFVQFLCHIPFRTNSACIFRFPSTRARSDATPYVQIHHFTVNPKSLYLLSSKGMKLSCRIGSLLPLLLHGTVYIHTEGSICKKTKYIQLLSSTCMCCRGSKALPVYAGNATLALALLLFC